MKRNVIATPANPDPQVAFDGRQVYLIGPGKLQTGIPAQKEERWTERKSQPSRGAFSSVDDPNGVGTMVINGVNDSGEIVGFYVDSSGHTDGFLGTP